MQDLSTNTGCEKVQNFYPGHTFYTEVKHIAEIIESCIRESNHAIPYATLLNDNDRDNYDRSDDDGDDDDDYYYHYYY